MAFFSEFKSLTQQTALSLANPRYHPSGFCCFPRTRKGFFLCPFFFLYFILLAASVLDACFKRSTMQVLTENADFGFLHGWTEFCMLLQLGSDASGLLVCSTFYSPTQAFASLYFPLVLLDEILASFPFFIVYGGGMRGWGHYVMG